MSSRASKHLHCLIDHIQSNPQVNRGVVFFLVQRADCDSFSAAIQCDPEYAYLLNHAYTTCGVEVLIYSIELNAATGEVVLGESPLKFVSSSIEELEYARKAKKTVSNQSDSKRKRKKQKTVENT